MYLKKQNRFFRSKSSESVRRYRPSRRPSVGRHRNKRSRSRSLHSYDKERRRKMKKRRKKESRKHARKKGNSSDRRQDDTVAAFDGKVGEWIDGRYKIVDEAGVGTFGRVLTCLDTKHDKKVAIKVIRAIPKYTKSAKIEAKILDDIGDKDNDGQSLIVKMYNWFEYRGHMCLVFEKLGQSLYDFLKKHDYRPYPINSIREYAFQLLTSLAFMHEMDLVHTDLKPENVLFVDESVEKLVDVLPIVGSPESCYTNSLQDGETKRSRQKHLDPPTNSAIKLIDFGGATYTDDRKSTIISTRQYRAPEVMLELTWDKPADIWSAACIIGELYVGDLFFPTHENLEHFAMIDKCVGPIPTYMIEDSLARHGKTMKTYFRRRDHTMRWPEGASSKQSLQRVDDLPLLHHIVDDNCPDFLDLLRNMFTIDPAKRITAKAALQHAFFDPVRAKAVNA